MANIKGLKMGTSATFEYLEELGGAQVSMDWIQSKVLKGKVFHAYVGSATTPVTLDAAYAATDPDLSLDVPDGTFIVPLRVVVVMEAYGTSALFETHTLCSKTLAAASAGTAFTPLNIRNRSAGGSACSCYVGPTVTDGHTTGAFELYRAAIQKVATIATGDDDSPRRPEIFEWNIGQNGFAPVLQGESSLQTWATSQAASGYIQYYWYEDDESVLP